MTQQASSPEQKCRGETFQPKPILSVNDLQVQFGSTPVVDKVSFDLYRSRTLAIVGESGSGKSISSLAIMGLVKHLGAKVSHGSMQFESDLLGSVDLAQLPEEKHRIIRGREISMIFQEPMASLNPVFTIGDQLCETLMIHRGISKKQAQAEACQLLDLVRIPQSKRILGYYPHQLSGGQLQRVMIAMAISCKPKILIADEPTTALDVTIQAQILGLISDLQNELNSGIIFISHNMAVVSEVADDILVMRNSKEVERNSMEGLLAEPKASYTRNLLSAVPELGSMQGLEKPRYFAQYSEEQETLPERDLDKQVKYAEPLLEVDKLSVRYSVHDGFMGKISHYVHAAEQVSFAIYPGETLSIVGESGSGKSTVGRTIQQLAEPHSGEVRLDGENLFELPSNRKKLFSREIQYVFQDPYGALNPRKTIGASIIEPAWVHGLVRSKKQADERVAELLEMVGLKAEHARRYPKEFSGGQRQRICIARALACEPKLIIADEAVSALDVSVQAQVVNLFMHLQETQGIAYLFISHDMAIVERISHRVAVMYLGQIVEIGSRQQIFENPQHPYTQKLIASVPTIRNRKQNKSPEMSAEIPSVIRKIGDEPDVHEYVEVTKGHLVANHSPALTN
ncbi:ABC transporter ATP-binding protein [Reinekea marinisedimentorum]|uniref:Glutathione import ATP-binding protein GsiA n=1 Tax=Reinekea marinisedimentorum TaxID=230495 RepID=A0A4R3IEV5_9GAMM|nr:ABC transporter ATP-binding protein [Reinekea marinisedimentorum]TCS43331.1 glutathione transport system ATP-binding protein [Reinekea marinisedimentorum]